MMTKNVGIRKKESNGIKKIETEIEIEIEVPG